MSSTAPPGPSTPNSLGGGATPKAAAAAASERNTDWADQVTDLFVDLVDSVRDKTTGPVLKIARGVVYGIVAFLVLIFVGIAGLIFLGRVAFLIPVDEWIIYLVIGILFSVLGLFLWTKRKA